MREKNSDHVMEASSSSSLQDVRSLHFPHGPSLHVDQQLRRLQESKVVHTLLRLYMHNCSGDALASGGQCLRMVCDPRLPCGSRSPKHLLVDIWRHLGSCVHWRNDLRERILQGADGVDRV